MIILTVSSVKVRTWGCFPLTHHLGGDFDHGKITRPAVSSEIKVLCELTSAVEEKLLHELICLGAKTHGSFSAHSKIGHD